MYCQVINGPRRAEGFGRTDGEGQERDWSSKRHLVAPGRSCGAETRRQMLDRQTQHYVTGKLIGLPLHLVELWNRAASVHKAAADTLNGFIDGPALEFRSMQGEIVRVDWSLDFVAEQASNEIEFFKSISHGKSAAKGNKEIFQALKVERAFEQKLEKTPLNEGSSEHVRNRWLKDLPEKKNRTDAILNKYGQTREEWSENSHRWIEALEDSKPVPGAEIFRAVEAERCYEQKLRPTLQERGVHVNNYLRKDRGYQRLRAKTKGILKKNKVNRAQWEVGSNNYNLHKRREVVNKLQEILADILQQVTSRAVELKSVHSRVHGQNQSNPILKSLYGRFPKLKVLIDSFNQKLRDLPCDPRIPVIKPLTFESFHPATGDESIDQATEGARYMILLQLDILSCLSLGDQLREHHPSETVAGIDSEDEAVSGTMRGDLKIYHKMTSGGTWFAWGLSDDVNAAIQCYHRIARATEEQSMLTLEARRLSLWIHARIEGLLNSLDGKAADNVLSEWRELLLPMLWRDAKILFQVSRLPQDLLPVSVEQQLASKRLLDRAHQVLTEALEKPEPEDLEIYFCNDPVEVHDPDADIVDELYPFVLPDETGTELLTAALDYVGEQQQQTTKDTENTIRDAEIASMPEEYDYDSGDEASRVNKPQHDLEDRDYSLEGLIAGMDAL
jgi:hypothetical protein